MIFWLDPALLGYIPARNETILTIPNPRPEMRLLRTALLLLIILLTCRTVAFAEDPDNSDVVDVKPHYAPLAVVETFVVGDCKKCLETLKTMNELESSAGNRRGRVMFLAYVLARDKTEEQSFDQTGAGSREQILARWNTYTDLFKMRVVNLPTLIVNGRKFFSNSKIEILDKALDHSLLQPVKVAVSLELGKISLDGIQVKYSIQGLPKSRHNDLYYLTIAGVKPHTPIPIYTVDGVDTDEVWANFVEACDAVRIQGDGSGDLNLHFPEEIRPKVSELVAYLQDARTGKPVSGDTIRVKLPKPSR